MPKDISRYLDLVVRSCYLTYGKWSMEIDDNLVGGLDHFLFCHILGRIIPTDKYFSEGLKPPTSNMHYKHDNLI